MAKHDFGSSPIGKHFQKASAEFERQAGVARTKIAQGVVTWEGLRIVARLSRGIGIVTRGIALAVGVKAFASEWKWARLALPLQTRLAAEQGLWDLGGDYRRLVSGFKPIEDGGDIGSGVGRKREQLLLEKETSKRKRERQSRFRGGLG